MWSCVLCDICRANFMQKQQPHFILYFLFTTVIRLFLAHHQSSMTPIYDRNIRTREWDGFTRPLLSRFVFLTPTHRNFPVVQYLFQRPRRFVLHCLDRPLLWPRRSDLILWKKADYSGEFLGFWRRCRWRVRTRRKTRSVDLPTMMVYCGCGVYFWQ